MTIKELTQLIVAITALVTALSAMGVGCHNSERLDRHANRISENTDTITSNAQATNDVAESVGLPAMASPPNLETKK